MKKNKFWAFKAVANNAAELYLYGPISESSWWGDEVTPKQFKQDLDDLGDIATLDIYINSYGGDVFAGQAIHSMLKRNKAYKTVHVDGLAASIASIIAMAGDVVHMPLNSMMMVHNPWTFAMGNADELRKMADDLDQIGKSLLAVYREKTGLSDEKITELLDAETWLTAEEAVELGFADQIDQEKKIAASLRNKTTVFNGVVMDLSRYSKFPADKVDQTPETIPKAETEGISYVERYKRLVLNNERRLKTI